MQTCMHDVCTCMLLLDETEHSMAEVDYSALKDDQADEEVMKEDEDVEIGM